MKDIATKKADVLARNIYKATKSFPKDELYGITSQLRRAVISIVLNLIEGYTRKSKKEYYHFLELAYGSLKEVKYLLYFSYKEEYMSKKAYTKSISIAEEVGKLIWAKMKINC